MSKPKLICVDFQKDFTEEGGAHFKPRPSAEFIKNTLVPFFRDRNLKIAEIISDYRQPRPGHSGDFCKPGTNGYVSDIPEDVKDSTVWVKSANSPIWTRENIGDPTKPAGLPYEDPDSFGQWLDHSVGKPGDIDVVACGLTADRCVLMLVQELDLRGFNVFVLEEATDSYSGNQSEKEQIMRGPILKNWTDFISWDKFQQLFK